MVRFLWKWKSPIIQLILCVLVLPYLCFLVGLFLPDAGADILLNTVQELPVVGPFLGILGEAALTAVSAPQLSVTALLHALLQVTAASIMQATVIGMALYAVRMLVRFFLGEDFGSLNLLLTVAGVLVGCILLGYMRLDGTALMTTAAFLTVLCVVMTILDVTSGFLGKVLRILFGLGLQAVISGAASAYACLLAYVAAGCVEDPLTLLALGVYIVMILGALLVLNIFLDLL